MEEILAKLIAIPTPTDDIAANDAALDYIDAFLEDCGMHVKRFRFDGHGSLVATSRPNVKNPIVLLNAHVDVMDGTDELFTLQRHNGKLYGRGTYDMKAAIAAYMQLASDLQGSLAEYDFGIMITTDEEYGDRDNINGTKKLIGEGYIPGICIIPDGGTDWNIETLAKGHWRFDLIAKGRTGHGSRPWEGESASLKLINALHELQSYFKTQGPLTDTLNIAAIQGGKDYNQIPDAMSARVEIRLSEKGSLARNKTLIDSICQKHDITYIERALSSPLFCDLEHSMIAAFAESIRHITGTQPKGCISYGGSDAIHFAEVGVPCILTRPIGGNLHGPSEWIDQKSLSYMLPVLHDYLDRTAKTSPISVDTKATVV